MIKNPRPLLCSFTVLSVGALVSTPKSHPEAKPVITYQGKLLKTDYSLTDATGAAVMAFTQARTYSTSKKYTVLYTSPELIAEEDYTLSSGATLDNTVENWHGFYTTGEAVTSAGTAVATGEADVPFGLMQ